MGCKGEGASRRKWLCATHYAELKTPVVEIYPPKKQEAPPPVLATAPRPRGAADGKPLANLTTPRDWKAFVAACDLMGVAPDALISDFVSAHVRRVRDLLGTSVTTAPEATGLRTVGAEA
jgi:hypothetical protein